MTWTSYFGSNQGFDSEANMPDLQRGDDMTSVIMALRDSLIRAEQLVGLSYGKDPTWNPLSTSLPFVGVVPEVVYQFTGVTIPTWFLTNSLAYKAVTMSAMQHDLSGNGHHLTLSTRIGPVVSDLYANTRGFLDCPTTGSSTFYETVPSAALQTTGALTVELIYSTGMTAEEYVNGPESLFQFDPYGVQVSSWASSNDNVLYSLRVNQGPGNLYYYAQKDHDGADISAYFDAYLDSGKIYYITLTRSALGGVKLYLQGQLIGEGSTVPPSGGSSGKLWLLGYNSMCWLNSFRLTKAEFTAAQVLSCYTTVRGL